MKRAVRIAEWFRVRSKLFAVTCSAMLLLAVLVSACSQGGERSATLVPSSPSSTTVPTSQPNPTVIATSTPRPTALSTSTVAAPTVTPLAQPISPAMPTTTNGDNTLIETGRAEFNEHCLECHDDNGTGTPGILIRYERLSEQRIKTVVREGFQVACCFYMNPMSESQISDDQIHALVVFLRSVQPDTFTSDN